MDKQRTYKTNRHSCYDLEYHLVVVTGYRHPVLTGDIEIRLKEITERLLTENWGCELEAMECDRDHIHILFSAPPQVCLSELVNNYKTVTSRLLRKEFAEQLKPYYWKNALWSKSYFIGGVNERTHDMVEQYIHDQKNKARFRTVQKPKQN